MHQCKTDTIAGLVLLYFSLVVRTLINLVGETGQSDDQLIALCLKSIEWCKEEKRTFLRQRIESRLASLYLKMGKFNDALTLIKDLTREVKKLDDKLLLVEVYLTESRIQMRLQNTPTSKVSVIILLFVEN